MVGVILDDANGKNTARCRAGSTSPARRTTGYSCDSTDSGCG
ncbi:hypothetical protein GDO81_019333 [Engystomops pustulosus]|uniref:Uncharacterized protein n=1 Tax=Engystomops pustulosus TaxID=76066 RepID=A0AAV6ZFU8_ENGPU|nr:hypothetical protein GDO81_019333 [Engystomops pustulosus]